VSRPYTQITIAIRHPGQGFSKGLGIATSFGVLLEDVPYLEVAQKIYQAFDHPFPADLQGQLEDKLAQLMPLLHQEQARAATTFSRVAKRLEEMKRIRMDIDRRISLGDLGKVCAHILYTDFLQYKPDIQERIIILYEGQKGDRKTRWRLAHDWLYKRSFSIRSYRPGEPGTLFPRRTPQFWKRREAYADPMARRSRKRHP
jgi:hypothetical protein